MIAKHVIKACITKSRSVSALAEKTGYSNFSIQRWASGEREPKFKAVIDCCDAAGVDLAFMLSGYAK